MGTRTGHQKSRPAKSRAGARQGERRSGTAEPAAIPDAGRGGTLDHRESRLPEDRRAALALRASEERFRATFNQAAVGLAHLGADLRYLLVNKKLCDILGYSAEELLQKTGRSY